MTATSNANTSGLTEIISDDEILRVHGHANFGLQMTPREVVNEGVLKYAFGYHSGHTQLCILMAHGLITKPRPGSYDASLTKKGKRYARALGGYQNAVTAASAQARIAELERDKEELARTANEWTTEAHERLQKVDAAEARADRLAKGMPDLSSVIGWLANGCDPKHAVDELRIYQARIDAALQQETQP